MKFTKLMILILCLAGVVSFLNAQAPAPLPTVQAPVPSRLPTVQAPAAAAAQGPAAAAAQGPAPARTVSESAALVPAPQSADETVTPDQTEYQKYPEVRLYNVESRRGESKPFKEVFEKIDDLTSLVAVIDKNDTKFDLKQPAYVKYNMVVWDGYLKVNEKGTYTFMVSAWSIPYVNSFRGAFGITINDKDTIIVTEGECNHYQEILDAELKVGYNKVRFCFFVNPSVADAEPGNPRITYKKRNVVTPLIDINPGKLCHKVAGDW
ncbi:MAG: hypothetical protein IKP58_12360 [Victivallales bacterium]|nr:hypothetical protein [Victivallales bacterium]